MNLVRPTHSDSRVSRWSPWGQPAACALIALAALVTGCQPHGSTPPKNEKPASPHATPFSRRANRNDVLFTTVVRQLRNLPSFVDTELTPPSVVLDAKASSDGGDVLAVCGTAPGSPDGPINCITTTTHNGHFRSLGIRPGDILKYYVLYDEDSAETGISQTVSMDLTVAQVLDEDKLLVQGGLNRPVAVPAKIEIWRYSDERLQDIARDVATYVRYRLPIFDWEPSPDSRVMKQMTERLNQWMRQSQPKTKWSADPLLQTLDPKLAADDRLAPLITPAALADLVVQPYEGRRLQEAVWLRDIGRWTQGDSFDDLPRASALFDWIVRNVQLDAEDAALPYRPWESLIYGHGTAEQRAWIFALMARQLGLDVVVLEVPSANPESPGKGAFWLPALLSDGKLYLFDTRLGLPILAKDGHSVATLADVQADPALLRVLDLEDFPYSVTAEQLQHVTAHVVADAFNLSRRAAAIEAKLSGDDRLALAVNPSALAEKLGAVPGLAAVEIWDFPFRTMRDKLRRRSTCAGRWRWNSSPLRGGPICGKPACSTFRDTRRATSIRSPPTRRKSSTTIATRLASTPSRRSARPIACSTRSLPSRKGESIRPPRTPPAIGSGLLLFDEGQFDSAEVWLSDPRLVGDANSRWAEGTRYNLARTYEA